jgi:hypothetical protein
MSNVVTENMGGGSESMKKSAYRQRSYQLETIDVLPILRDLSVS